MTEEQKNGQSIAQSSLSDPQKLLLKQTLKQNKSLQSKNSKLQTKYIELFKQHKLLKQDRTTSISFLLKILNENQQNTFQQPEIGNLNQVQLQKIYENKEAQKKKQIQKLKTIIKQLNQSAQIKNKQNQKNISQKIIQEYQSKIKSLKDHQLKEIQTLNRQVQNYKKINKQLSDECTSIKNNLDLKNQQYSKISRQKLKLQHHLNNIRKKQIAQQLSVEEKDHSKTIIDKNQLLSLRQQIQALMSKRDQLKRHIKKIQESLLNEVAKNKQLKQQLNKLKEIQIQNDTKYDLIRQCSIEDLQNMIIQFHSNSNLKKQKSQNIQVLQNHQKLQNTNHSSSINNGQQNDEIQREYLKNVIVRYIQAEVCGDVQQSCTLLQIIGTITKLDKQLLHALQSYKNKRKQWWYLKL